MRGLRSVVIVVFLLVASVVMSSVYVFSSERSMLENRRYGVVATLRIENHEELIRKVATLLSDINPHHNVDNPLRKYLGEILNNPALEQLTPKAWVEILFIKPDEKPVEVVVVFPITEAGLYRKSLSSRPGMRDEGTANDITSYGLDTKEGTESFFLSVTAARVAVFGSSKERVRLVRGLYDNAPLRGFFHDNNTDLCFVVQMNRYLQTDRAKIDESLSMLRDDIVRDISGSQESDNKQLGRLVDRVSRRIFDILSDIRRLEAHIGLDREKIRVSLDASVGRGSPLDLVLSNARSGEPSLASALPEGCVSFHDTLLWTRAWRGIAEGFGETAALGIGGMIEEDISARLRRVLDDIENAGPEEAVSASMPPPEGSMELGPLWINVTRFRDIKALERARNGIRQSLRDGSPLQNLLLQNNLLFKLGEEKDVSLDRGGVASQFEFSFRIASDRSDKYFSDLVNVGNFMLSVTHGNYLIVVSCRKPDNNALAAARTLEVQKKVMQRIIDKLDDDKKMIAETDFFRRGRTQLGDRKGFMFALISPLEYLQMSMDANADWRANAGSSRRIMAERRYANEFRRTKSRRFPVSLGVSASSGRIGAEITIPVESIRELSRACLDIGGSD